LAGADLSFRADVQVHGTMLDLSLQPLDGLTKVPWAGVDRHRVLMPRWRIRRRFRHPTVPQGAYPLLADPFLTVDDSPQRRDDLERRILLSPSPATPRCTGPGRPDRIRLEDRRSARCASPATRCPRR
jgi:hypothetical protein